MIESPRNARVQSLLRERQEGRIFVVEGEKFVLDAAAAGFSFEEIFHDAGVKPGRLARLSGQKPTPVAREVLARFCDAKTPQHVVGLARRKESSAPEILARPGPAVYLEGVQDPGNVGAVARVVEAVGGAGLLVSEGSADFFHPRALRGSAGSLLRVPAASNVDMKLAAESAHDAGRVICGTAGRGGEDLFSAELPERVLWVFGSEGAGLSSRIHRLLDRKYTIPLAAPVESLNVAVAAGVALFTASRRPAFRTPAPPDGGHS
ncbi:MAG TPA: RNA methyltransferase [Thermoanaerobaculia bacterium]|nr:RNA methyltransferase [Thermoanaerobaculia bacterium]